MQELPYRVKTYNGKIENLNTVYLLNKGLNSGKPSYTPFRNSFAVICNDKTTADRIYATATLLLISKTFEPFLMGSVIPFIHIKHVKDVLQKHRKLITDKDLSKELDKIHVLLANEKVHYDMVRKLRQLVIGYARAITAKAL